MKKGIIALPTVILIGGIIIEISLALALVIYFLLQSGAGSKYSAQALVLAQSGADDAIMRVIRNKNIGSALASPFPYFYIINFDSVSAVSVIVCKDLLVDVVNNSCSVTSNTGKTQIIATGKVSNKNRRVQAMLSTGLSSGEVKKISENEISL